MIFENTFSFTNSQMGLRKLISTEIIKDCKGYRKIKKMIKDHIGTDYNQNFKDYKTITRAQQITTVINEFARYMQYWQSLPLHYRGRNSN